MEIVKRNSTQLSPDQDLHSVTLRTSRTSCRQVHVYSPSTLSHLARCAPERLNPSRFSDPLHRATLLRRSLALTLPQRVPKAYSWYLDNRFPWKREHSRPVFEDVPCSLFGRRGSGHTYLRRVPPIYLIPSHDDLQDRGPRREEVRLSEGWADRSSDASGRWRLWGTRSDRTPSPDRLSPYTGSLRSRRSLSPGFSHRYSPVFGDKLAPFRSDLPPSGLSPRSSHLLQLSPSGLSPRSSRVLQWINRNYPSPTPYTHSGARASPSSTISINSKDDDTSIGSQTDDDFVFVSCSQLVKGLANLSIPSQSDSPPVRQQEVSGGHDAKHQRPVFYLHRDHTASADDDISFELCSEDDVLSDDVFLDENPQPVTRPCDDDDVKSRAEGQGSGAGRNEGTADDESDCPEVCSALAVEALRRNSLQGKWRRLWRNRRVRAAEKRQKPGSAKDDTAVSSSQITAEIGKGDSSPVLAHLSPSVRSLSPSRATVPFSSSPDVASNPPCSPQAENQVDERSYHYVISPTDDVSMPEVIAVRKSSVELLKWQNSLRRRRRRQAKRHDLSRSKARAPIAAPECHDLVTSTL